MIGWLRSLAAGGSFWWLAGAFALLLAAIGVQQLRVVDAQRDLALEQRDRKDERARRAERALLDVAAAKAEGERRVADLQRMLDETQPALDAALAAADSLPDLNRRVRDATAALRICHSARAADPAPSGGSASPEETARVLAELQRESQAAEEARTRYADKAGFAAERCERAYGTLTPTPGPAVPGAE